MYIFRAMQDAARAKTPSCGSERSHNLAVHLFPARQHANFDRATQPGKGSNEDTDPVGQSFVFSPIWESEYEPITSGNTLPLFASLRRWALLSIATF